MEREPLGYPNNTGLSQDCLPPSSLRSSASRAVPAGRERAQGDPSSCEAAPARKAARPHCHKPGISCPQSPAAGCRRSSSTRHSYSWGIRGKPHISKGRTTARAAPSLLLGRTQQQQLPRHPLPTNQTRDIRSEVSVPAAVTCRLREAPAHGCLPQLCGEAGGSVLLSPLSRE